jgi:hypothetical protein
VGRDAGEPCCVTGDALFQKASTAFLAKVTCNYTNMAFAQVVPFSLSIMRYPARSVFTAWSRSKR